ncbi:hypothetical protein NEMIN01_1038 [Nematocida minor]|uniref:uncharacterized protein n=1 Tax=Nematocida minor TaxID=1912983 RepID=UPI002220064E|nr:uncharacterized protein NEMIN01_1038 [Nematocida minor]KAI5190414.1 hypothetical protein NEMIN01_1038 [Nematocida minor]
MRYPIGHNENHPYSQNAEIVELEDFADRRQDTVNYIQSQRLRSKIQQEMQYPILSHLQDGYFKTEFSVKSVLLLSALLALYLLVFALKKISALFDQLDISYFVYALTGVVSGMYVGSSLLFKKRVIVFDPSNEFREYAGMAALTSIFIMNLSAPRGSLLFCLFDTACMLSIASIWAFKNTFQKCPAKGYFVRKVISIITGSVLFSGVLISYIGTYHLDTSCTGLLLSSLILSCYALSSFVVQYTKMTSIEEIITSDMVKILLQSIFWVFLVFLEFCYASSENISVRKIIISPTLGLITGLSIAKLIIKSCEADVLYYATVNRYKKTSLVQYVYDLIFKITVALLIISAVLVFIFDTRYRLNSTIFTTLKKTFRGLRVLKQ